MYLSILGTLSHKLGKEGLLSEAIIQLIKKLDDSEKERIEAEIKKHMEADSEINKRISEEIRVLKEL